jgi:hypothetical protein
MLLPEFEAEIISPPEKGPAEKGTTQKGAKAR